jgi:phospholipase/carboxylesterase
VSKLGNPTVEWSDDQNPSATLIVLLHGWGEDETDMLQLVDHLPTQSTYASVRGPYVQGRNHAWFAAGQSLQATCRWFEGWLDQVSFERPILLVGFSAGAAFAIGALLFDPARYFGAAMLCGTLPFDADVPIPPRHLVGLDIFLAHKLNDTMIPRELLDRTWSYLTEDSGARCRARRYEGNHGVSPAMLSDLSVWLGDITAESKYH